LATKAFQIKTATRSRLPFFICRDGCAVMASPKSGACGAIFCAP